MGVGKPLTSVGERPSRGPFTRTMPGQMAWQYAPGSAQVFDRQYC